MSDVIQGAIAAKAIVAKVCAAAIVVGGTGLAYTSIPQLESDELGSVSVTYAAEDRQQLAFGTDFAPEGAVQIPVRYEGNPSDVDREPTEAGTNRDGWNDHDNNEVNNRAGDSGGTPEPVDEPMPAEVSKSQAQPDKAPIEADEVAPEIAILYPADGARFENKVVVFEGETEPGSKVFAGKYQANVDSKGNWRIELVLSPGANGATLSATDAAGNTSVSKVTVWLDIEEPEPVKKADTEPETEPKSDHDKAPIADVVFYAKQKYGSCDAEVPYEILWGKATPHTVVAVTSLYGSGVAEVSKDGYWEIKLYFPEAPRNSPFNITVTAANGSATFGYVAKGQEPEPEAPIDTEPGEGIAEPEQEPTDS